MSRPLCDETPHNAAQTQAFPRATVRTVRVQGGEAIDGICNAICERELEIFVDGEQLVTLLCSPVDLRELAHGFLYSEQVIGSLADIRSFSLDQAALKASFELAAPYGRPACPTVSSGFGGKVLVSGTGVDIPLSCASHEPGDAHAVEEAVAVSAVMCAQAREYAVTRGMHCSALFRGDEMLAIYEDVGRHNTFDKLSGRCLLEGVSPRGALLATTGRVSGEMMRKALRLGVRGVVSLSGPTDVAIEIARTAGALLVGYAKNGSATVYAGFDAPSGAGLHACEAAAL